MKKSRIIKLLLVFMLSLSIIAGGTTHSSAEEAVLEPAIQIENKKLDKTLNTARANSQELNTTENLAKIKTAMKSGSITFRFKFNVVVDRDNTAVARVNGLLGASNNTTANQYAVLYVSRNVNGQETIGFEKRSAAGSAGVHAYNVALKPGTLNNTNWHTLTYTFKEIDNSKSKATVYLDGDVIDTADITYNFFNTIKNNLNSVTLGGVDIGTTLKYDVDGSMDMVQIHNEVLEESQVKVLHQSTDVIELPEMTNLWQKGTLINSREEGDDPNGVAVSMYRIPSIVKTDSGKLIAAADARKYHYNDWGDIATVVRTSDDGKTWNENNVVIDMPTNSNFDKRRDFIKDGYYPNSKRTQSAVAIDPVLLHADGTTYLFVDICPESNGAIDATSTSAYEKIKGKWYLNLYDRQNNRYTVKENGVVYDGRGNRTDYVVQGYNAETLTSTSNGELLKKGVNVGNIYLNGSGTKSGELHVLKTVYVWMFTSTDDGETWDQPRDLTPYIKEDYMKFVGTGPGAGIKAKKADGSTRLIFPIYYTTNGVGTNLGSQSSANIYSDDGGKTWIRGESPNDGRIVNQGTDEERTITSQTLNSQKGDSAYELTESQILQLKDGRLVQFMRNTSYIDTKRDYGVVQYSISEDCGETWGQVYDTDIREPYCQLSAITVQADLDGKGSKEYIAISNASGDAYSTKTLSNSKKARRVGHIRLCEINGDKLAVKHDKTIDDGGFAYSSLVQIDEDHIGIVYEKENFIMRYMKINFDYLTDKKVNVFSPKIESIKIDSENKVVNIGDELKIKVSFDQAVFMINGTSRQLNLSIGGIPTTAEYVSGSGTNELIFKYIVKDTDQGEIAASIENDAIIETVYGEAFDKEKNNNKLYTIANIGYNPEDKSNDITVVNAGGSAATSSTKALNAKDNDPLSYWISNANGAYLVANLKGASVVDGIRYLPRQGNYDGRITNYTISVSSDNNTYRNVATGSWMASDGWKSVSFEPQENVQYVKITITGSAQAPTTATRLASIAEIRVTGTSTAVKDNLSADIVSRYSTVRLSWNDVASASQYVISVSDKEDGTYKVIKTISATDSNNEFIHECGYGKNNYYKIVAKNDDGILDEQILHDNQANLDALKGNSIISKTFEEGNQTFDGQRVENLQDNDINSTNKSLQDLKSIKAGSIIVKFKRSPADSGDSAILGVNNAAADLRGNGTYSSLAILNNNTLKIVYAKAGSQAGFNDIPLSRDEWHTVVLSNDMNQYRLTIDGKEVKTVSNTGGFEVFSQLTSSVNSVTIGGQTGISNFKGEIEYVLVTNEILTSQEAMDLTAGYTLAVDKSELVEVINSTKTINLQEYTNATVNKYVRALEKANMINEAARPSQEEVDKATKNLMTAIEELIKIAYENNTVNITPVTIEDEVNKVVVGFKDLEEAEKVLKNDAMALDIVKKELKKGSYVEVVAESSALPVSDLSTTDKTQLNEYLKDIEKDEDTEIGQYLDVSLAIYAKDSQNTSEKREIARLDETSLLLDFEIDLDEKFNDRGVTIYRLHENDDGSKTIDTLYTTKENGKVIFESHLFSEFIMVVDKEKTSEVKPSDSTKPDGNKPDGSENPNTDNPMNQDDKTSSSQVNTSDQTRSIELLLGCMGIVAVVYFVINMKKEETK
ncbi:exo-alpha-sialidase [Coprobacillus cateniformis]|jgi:Neuraminidase (sialidase)|uniref:exo-alpha-sialidase n=1 Tax=Coprobacillus cateniformis TaxID=100884 RepID=UPI0024A9E69B|nr:exo-alpha-sialidase [Coprobacillus cateniformis]